MPNDFQFYTPPTPVRLKQFGAPSVWIEFSPLAQLCQAVNLGQGFPGWDPPDFVRMIASEMIQTGTYAQYARSAALPLLADRISHHYKDRLKRSICSQDEVVVTVGCSEAIMLAFLALVDSGDEVIFLEPSFDIYRAALSMIGGKSVSVPLTFDGQQFHIDLKAIEKAITPRTKAFVLNTPHNPTGKVFSHDELLSISSLLQKFPHVTTISDEVYEHLVFDQHKHISIATMPGMAQRTICLYSAGKTFSVTGWKIGWAIGPSDLIKRMQICQQWVVFSVATPLQAAVAHCLDEALKPFQGMSNYYMWLQKDYDSKRLRLLSHLQKAGLRALRPQGSFFVTVPLDQLPPSFQKVLPAHYQTLVHENKIAVDPSTLQFEDYNFCRSLTLDHKVTAIPYRAFYESGSSGPSCPLVRFAFCKPENQLDEAGKRLISGNMAGTL